MKVAAVSAVFLFTVKASHTIGPRMCMVHFEIRVLAYNQLPVRILITGANFFGGHDHSLSFSKPSHRAYQQAAMKI